MKIRAAVLDAPRGRFSIEPLELAAPRPGEVLVRLVATGVCHTDILARDQHVPFAFPGVLGHEGAGIVEQVGAQVTRVAEGDHVVLTWPSCGGCGNCVSGQPRYCDALRTLAFSGARADGTSAYRRSDEVVHGHFFGQSSFATHTLVGERNVVPVAASAPLELLGPLGCGVATGAGAILNVLRPSVGTSIAVLGVGSVGLSAVIAARLSGCTTICAVDVVPQRLELALELGATHAIDAREQDPVVAVRDAAGSGVDCSLECTGKVSVLRQAVDMLPTMRGVCGVVGGAPPETDIALDHKKLLWGKRVQGILGGEGQPERFIPLLVDLVERGRLPIDRLVTFYGLDEIDDAIRAVEDATAIKPVLRMGA